MTFGKRLKQLRLEKGVTQLQLSEILDTAKSNISKYEADAIEPNIAMLRKLAEYFNVSVDYLLGLTNKRFPDEDLEWRYPHVKNRLGNILNKYREKHHLSEIDFANQIGIDKDLFLQIELGIYSPSLKLLQKISEVTHYDIDYLTGAKDSTAVNAGSTKIGGHYYDTFLVESDCHFRSRLEELCLKNRINSDNVSDRLRLSKQEFLDIQWSRMPTLSELLRISYGLDVSIDYLVGKTDVPLTNLSSDELDLLLNYRDCIDSYKENLLKRAEKLSIESLGAPSVAADESLKKASGK